MDKHYGHFTPYELDAAINPLTEEAGNYYCRHVSALTEENLHAKSEIAAELGWRDLQIDTLKAELAEYRQDAERYRWLRGTVPESSSRWARWRLECWISGAWHELRGLHLDTCIDAARKGEGEQ